MAARTVALDSDTDPALAPYTAIRERDLVGRDGLFIAEGEVVLRVLTHRSPLRIRSLLLERRRVDAVADVLDALPEDVTAWVVPQAVMDRVAGFSIHRGVLALGERGPARDPTQLVEGPCALVALVGLTNHDNVGGIFRNAAAFGASAVLLDDATCDPLYRKAIRVSAGAALVVPFARAGGGAALVDRLVASGVLPIALSPRGEDTIAAVAAEIAARPPDARRWALILGTEGPGLPDSILARTRRTRIAMVPDFDSLNVAAASAIALHEMTGLR